MIADPDVEEPIGSELELATLAERPRHADCHQAPAGRGVGPVAGIAGATELVHVKHVVEPRVEGVNATAAGVVGREGDRQQPTLVARLRPRADEHVPRDVKEGSTQHPPSTDDDDATRPLDDKLSSPVTWRRGQVDRLVEATETDQPDLRRAENRLASTGDRSRRETSHRSGRCNGCNGERHFPGRTQLNFDPQPGTRRQARYLEGPSQVGLWRLQPCGSMSARAIGCGSFRVQPPRSPTGRSR